MPVLELSSGEAGRPRVGAPVMRTVNSYIEASHGPTPSVHIPRPGLTDAFTVGTGPILRQFQQPGLFNGDLFTISGGEIYRGQTLLGAVPYGNNPRMAAANGKLAIISGGSLHVYDGTALILIRYFDDGSSPLPPFTTVTVLYDVFIYPVSGSDTFYWSSVGDPTTINAADVSAAQTSPDPIVEAAVLAEEVMFFGSTSVEFWDYNGALTAPFALAQGRTYIRGCAAQGSVVKCDNAMFWVGDDLSVYRSSAVPMKISTAIIDDRLRAAHAGIDQAIAFYIGVEGHVFYVLNLPSINETHAYDCQTQQWAQWGTLQPPYTDVGMFAAGVSAGQMETTIYAGSATTNQVWVVDATSNMDGAVNKQVIVSGAIWLSEGVQRCNNVALACVRGVGDPAAPNPIVEMRFSDDGGRTWTSWLQSTLGMTGQYTYKAVWRNLGVITQPGRLTEFKVSDPVIFAVEGATWNAARV